MISVDFVSIPSDKGIRKVLQNAAKSALQNKTADLSIVVCDDEFIQNLNHQYRSIDRPTDVLSFPSDEIDPKSSKPYLGDIIISLPRAILQASEAQHSVNDELSMLVIHGVLHLLGFDHQNQDEKVIMWSKQEQLLASLGIIMDKFSGED